MKAFMNYARLESITIPVGVEMIGQSAFNGSGLAYINFEDNSLLGEIEIMVRTFNQNHCSLSKFQLYSNIPN